MSRNPFALPAGVARNLTEAQWQQLVLRQALADGWRVAHFLPAMRGKGAWATHQLGQAGFPDLVLARDGQVLLRELKRYGGKVTVPQQCWLDALGDYGGVWRPENHDDVLAQLRRVS